MLLLLTCEKVLRIQTDGFLNAMPQIVFFLITRNLNHFVIVLRDAQSVQIICSPSPIFPVDLVEVNPLAHRLTAWGLEAGG